MYQATTFNEQRAEGKGWRALFACNLEIWKHKLAQMGGGYNPLAPPLMPMANQLLLDFFFDIKQTLLLESKTSAYV